MCVYPTSLVFFSLCLALEDMLEVEEEKVEEEELQLQFVAGKAEMKDLGFTTQRKGDS